MARQFKKHVMKAEDVDPNVVYMVNKKPCKIECTREPGWKRGFVQVQRDGSRFYAYGKFFDGSYAPIPLQWESTDFYFADVHGCASLKALDVPAMCSWLDNQRSLNDREMQKVLATKNTLDLIERSLKEETHEAD